MGRPSEGYKNFVVDDLNRMLKNIDSLNKIDDEITTGMMRLRMLRERRMWLRNDTIKLFKASKRNLPEEMFNGLENTVGKAVTVISDSNFVEPVSMNWLKPKLSSLSRHHRRTLYNAKRVH